MMEQRRFCNRCGRLYSGDKCHCTDNLKKEKKYHSPDFYNTKAWHAVSKYIRTRDLGLDRLQLYFTKNKPANDIEKDIYNFLLDANDIPRAFGGKLIVHHVEELDDNWKRRYDFDNLISLNFHTHEHIHQLYFEHKSEVQNLLFKAIKAELP